jgi:ComF family protein
MPGLRRARQDLKLIYNFSEKRKIMQKEAALQNKRISDKNKTMSHKFAASRLKNVAVQVTDAILPPRCVVSGEEVDRQGMLAPKVWAGLDLIGAPLCDICGVPFEFEAGIEAQCGACLQDRPLFNRARSALKYNDSSCDLVLGFKHGDQTHAALAFVPLLRRAGAELIQNADLIVPVPLHRWRLFARRYNQAAIMAHYLGHDSGVPVIPDGLIRHRATPSQGHLKAVERQKNVRGAFMLNPKRTAIVAGKNTLLVDDVYTTGSTVEECVKTLIKGGAASVDVLTLARRIKE